mmetsp:Transcript_3429/g.5350  ORF Transcript_3429/g.5350 Transcript_3429/m.5350 type:complete len:773 (+) Transcript_3429:63-2381(+)
MDGSGAVVTPAWALDNALEKVEGDYKDLSDGVALTDKIKKNFMCFYEDPRREELQRTLKCDLTIDEARVLLFYPTKAHICFYPTLLQSSEESTTCLKDDFRLFVLSLVYIVHRKRWPFLRDFVIAGGLSVLVNMLTAPNLYARGQAVEIFLSITDCDTFDWFQPINSSQIRTALYMRLLSLSRGPLLGNLLANRVGSYPGGSMRCLQLLAFWLSWVRVMFTGEVKDSPKRLQLSAELLEEVSHWSTLPTDCNTESEAYHEAKLAETLIEDFRQAGVANNGGGVYVYGHTMPSYSESDLYCIPESILLIDDREHEVIQSNEDIACSVDSATCSNQISLTDPSPKPFKFDHWTVQQIKEKGNDLFKKSQYIPAGECYLHSVRKLLATMDGIEDSEEDINMLSTLHNNIASVYWKLHGMSHDEIAACLADAKTSTHAVNSPMLPIIAQKLDSKESLLEACMTACKECLKHRPHHLKAIYRLCSCLYAQFQPDRAIEVMDSYLEDFPQEMRNTDEFVNIQNLRRKCIARAIIFQRKAGADAKNAPIKPVNTSADAETRSPPSCLVDDQTNYVLTQLQNRRKREKKSVQHAWDGIDRSIETPQDGESLLDGSAVEKTMLEMRIDDNVDDNFKKKSSGKISKSDQKKKEDRKAAEVAQNKKYMKYYKKIRKLVCEIRTLEIPSTACDDLKSTLTKVVRNIWKDGLNLKQVFSTMALDEDILLSLLLLLCDHMFVADEEHKLVTELRSCDRFNMTLQLALSGNDSSTLVQYVKDTQRMF